MGAGYEERCLGDVTAHWGEQAKIAEGAEEGLVCRVVVQAGQPSWREQKRVGGGRLFGLGQSTAHQWIHALLVVLRATLRTLGDAPPRSVTELAKRLGMAEAEDPLSE